jgi:RNA polymerase sigma factor (sigma-70 family)
VSRAGSQTESGQGRGSEFTTTHWTVVREAGQAGSPGASEALELLCRNYWYPLYAFVRRGGSSQHDAQDLTQAFFARFLEHKYVGLADQSRGKFRTFMIRSLKHFLANEWNKERADKRGGRSSTISFDEADAENRYLLERADHTSPDKLYDKRWAMSLLEAVLKRLRGEFSAAGKSQLFDGLKVSAWGEASDISYAELGQKIGMAEGAVKVAAHRLRQRYRELLRMEVARTVDSETEVDEELRYLARILRS